MTHVLLLPGSIIRHGLQSEGVGRVHRRFSKIAFPAGKSPQYTFLWVLQFSANGCITSCLAIGGDCPRLNAGVVMDCWSQEQTAACALADFMSM